MEVHTLILAGFGLSNIALLTGIFFRLGKGQARFEELFGRLEKVEAELSRIVGELWDRRKPE